MTDPEFDNVLADGRPFVRCGCGFMAVSIDQEKNLQALDLHECPLTFTEEAPEPESRWYHHVFSVWGVAVLFVIGYILTGIFGHGS